MHRKAIQFSTIAILALSSLSVLLALAKQTSLIAVADIYHASSKAIGSASFRQSGNQTQIMVKVSGISPGKHGIHIHTGAACTDTQDSAGNLMKIGGALGHRWAEVGGGLLVG